MRLFMVAGEPSGDVLGGALLDALRAVHDPAIEVAGVGGVEMARAGLHSLFPIADVAVMGLLSIVPRLPIVMHRLRLTVQAMRAFRPDVVVTIDSPAFTLRIARQAKRAGIPVIHYVAPQYWAWRPWRLKRLPQKIDHLLALFPFEPQFFEAGGVPTTYVGHPAIERMPQATGGGEFRKRHQIEADIPLLAVLPGSRTHLARRMLPIFHDALQPVLARSRLHLVIPVVETVRQLVTDTVRRYGWPATLVADSAERRQAMTACSAALTVSGTISLELALADVPMVVTYRVDELSARIARRLISVRHASLPNLILDAPLVPELIQWDCTPRRIAEQLTRVLHEQDEAARQRRGFAELRRILGTDGEPPSRRAARAVWEFVERRRVLNRVGSAS